MRPEDLEEADGDLAQRIAAGSAPDAERELVRRFAPRVRLYGIKHLRNEEQARDLVQEVLLLVIEALRARRVEDPALVDRFTLGVCRNVVLAWRRGEARRRDLSAQLVAVLEPAVGPVTSSTGDLARLRSCVERLAARDQDVLVLSYCAEHSADEIGRRLGLSAGNVRVMRHRALARVRACVAGGAP
jgi:RNA polymerase sigma-70 factor (ECF subfamily)